MPSSFAADFGGTYGEIAYLMQKMLPLPDSCLKIPKTFLESVLLHQ